MSRIPRRSEPITVIPGARPSEVLIPGDPNIRTLEQQNLVTNDEVLDELLESVKAEIQSFESDGIQPPGDTIITQIGGRSPDSCAHYLSFRFGPNWGIYIRRECLISLAEFIHANGAPRDVAAREAFFHLYAHEYFHFAVDTSTLALERIVGFTAGLKADYWVSHLMRNNPCEVEEALANSYAYDIAGAFASPVTAKNVRRALRDLMRRQPPGYCDFESVRGSKKKSQFRSHLLTTILTSATTYVPDLDRLISLPPKGKLKKGLPKVEFEGMPLRVFVI